MIRLAQAEQRVALPGGAVPPHVVELGGVKGRQRGRLDADDVVGVADPEIATVAVGVAMQVAISEVGRAGQHPTAVDHDELVVLQAAACAAVFPIIDPGDVARTQDVQGRLVHRSGVLVIGNQPDDYPPLFGCSERIRNTFQVKIINGDVNG